MVGRTDGAATALRLGYPQLADLSEQLSWRDLLYGWDRGLVEADAIVRLAAQRLGDGDEGPSLELALLLADQHDEYARTWDAIVANHAEEVPGLLRAAAEAEPPSTSGAATEQKWMYLLLRALYQAQDRLTEPLAAVEDVYELFDHPAELAGLVYYIPEAPPVASVSLRVG